MPRRPQRIAAAFALLPLIVLPSFARAQEAPGQTPRADPLRVFLDCNTRGCNGDYFRTELEWVSWVRDREVADVHLLITSQNAGGGGDRYTLDFLGLGAFEGEDRQLFFTTTGDATDDERRSGLVQRIGLGLVPFALGTEPGQLLIVDYPEVVEGDDAAVQVVDDPWNFWVFEVGLNGNLDGESRQKSFEVSGSLSANRTTEEWKLNAEAEYSRNEEEFELEDQVLDVLRENWSVETFAVNTLADHWSAGLKAETGKSTRFNQDLYVTVAPGIEFSVFPYGQSQRRSLVVQYLVGVNHFNWADTTIYNEIAETRLNESLTASLDLVQPWGGMDVSLTGAHYFYDLDRWSLDLSGRVNVRLFQGFSLRFGGNYRWIRDQLHIPAAGLDDEDILLELQQLETDFSYRTFFGVSYRFGSIFNNVVNPRFGGLGGGGGRGGFDFF